MCLQNLSGHVLFVLYSLHKWLLHPAVVLVPAALLRVCQSQLEQGHADVQTILGLPEVCCARIAVDFWPDLHAKAITSKYRGPPWGDPVANGSTNLTVIHKAAVSQQPSSS